MTEISDSLQALLARQGMRGNGAGTPALHVMKWANALLDREEGEVEPMHSPAGGEEDRRFENSGKGPDAKTPGQVFRDGRRHTAGETTVNLRLVYSSNRRRPTRYVIGPRLVLIEGGKR
jgi:hypothetical protein